MTDETGNTAAAGIAESFSCVGKPLTRPDVAAKATGAAVYAADIVAPRHARRPDPHESARPRQRHSDRHLQSESPSRGGRRPHARTRSQDELHPLRDGRRSAPIRLRRREPGPVHPLRQGPLYRRLDSRRRRHRRLHRGESPRSHRGGIRSAPRGVRPGGGSRPGAPVIHKRWKDNVAGVIDHPFGRGDLEEALAESDHVVEFTGRNSRQKQAHMEPDAAVARWDDDGRLTVWSPCQNAHLAKKTMAQRVLGIGEGDIRWITTTVGGGFGARLSFGVEPLAVLLARVTGKPVKVFVTREEDFQGWSSRTEQRQTIRMGVTDSGIITAIEQRILSDAGAYFSHSGTISAVNMQSTLGLMRSPVIAGKATIVYTNNPTSSGMRGYGNPEGSFILQQAIDMAAEKCSMDPLEFRLKNAKGVGEPSMWEPANLTSCALETCIRSGAERIGWKDRWQGWGGKKTGRYRRGVGMSIMTHASGAGGFLLEHSSAIIKLDEDGSAQLTVSPCEMGQGILGALSQIAAEAVGLRFDDIHVITGDTDVTLFDIGSHASRSTYAIGNAVLDAGKKIRAAVLERAASRLEAIPDALDIREGRVFLKADPGKAVTVAEISSAAIYDYGMEGRHITATGKHQAITHCPNFQAGFAEVEVDTETGVIKVVKFVVAHDIGRAINPLTVESCLEGGAYQGLGYALTEDLIIDQHTGRVLTDSFATYKMLSTLDMPEVVVILVEEPDPSGPFGAKGVGETGITNVAPSIANALYDAVGIRIHSLPMTPEKVLKALGRTN